MLSTLRIKVLQRDKVGSILCFFGLLILIGINGTFASDMYAPSLPHIASYFGTSPTSAKFTITIYFLSFAIVPLIFGPFSDRYGRRKMLLAGLILFLLGSIVCAFSPSIATLILGRFIQGAGAGAMVSLNRSIARDAFSGAKLAQFISYLSMTFAIMPMIAPVLGGYFQHYLGWRSAFVFMLIYSAIVLLIIYLFLPETNQKLNIHSIEPAHMFKNYKSLLRHYSFISHTILVSTATASIMAYYTITPFLFQNVLHVSALEFGWLTTLIAASIFIGKGLNVLMLYKYAPSTVLIQGGVVMFLSSLVMLALGLIGIVSILTMLLPMAFFVVGSGLVIASGFSSAMEPFKHIAGCASSLFSSLQMLEIFVVTYIAAHLHAHNPLPLGILFTVLTGAALMNYFFMRKRTAFVIEGELVNE